MHSDGGARGNPGPAGIGAIIKRKSDGEILAQCSQYIGEATNNQAEYRALVCALEKLNSLMDPRFVEAECYLDSELVVKQLNREYRVKDRELASLFVKAWNLSQGFAKIGFFHVPRAENKDADKLVNIAIDEAFEKEYN